MQNTILNIHPTTSNSTATTTTTDLQQQLYLNTKMDLQAQVADPELWDVLRAKFEKYSALAGSCRDDAFRKRDHDENQGDDGPLEGEKSVKRQKTSKERQQQQQEWDVWVEDPVIDEDEVIPEDETLRVSKYGVRKQAEGYKMIKAICSCFFSPQRNLNKPLRYLYNKDLFFLKNRNTEEKRSRLIWERVHDFQLGIESYQVKINLTTQLLIFPGIEASDPFSILDEPRLGLIYLNNKKEKKVMDLVEIVKFCDATLERVLKEVKLKIFKQSF
uniref:Uncharacterized protein n=1 Tax=Tanacetum cinerariifolium TaxID=118510 RepID=A0A6L2LIM3_TANCI|nr:hypothetical protein [Tanacetum cinerariifolium]